MTYLRYHMIYLFHDKDVTKLTKIDYTNNTYTKQHSIKIKKTHSIENIKPSDSTSWLIGKRSAFAAGAKYWKAVKVS